MPLIDKKVIDAAIVCWGENKMYTQLMEECGEYIAEACHYLFREDRENDLDHFLEEVVGVRIAVDHVIAMHQEECEEIYKDQIGKEMSKMRKDALRTGILSVWGQI
jgi:hypothetical protein